jgi:adenylate cyclase
MQRRLAAIVAADVVGYSRLMGRDERGTLAALKAVRRDVIDPRIAAHNGRIVKTTGDGLLLQFASVLDAVRCVIDVQGALASHAAATPEDRRIVLRMGVNLGDIIVEGDDILGDGVNIAARLQEIAAPGGICVSNRVHDDIGEKIDVRFTDRGQRSLKNIERPIRVWSWSPAAAGEDEAFAALALPDKPSIAVLPFANLSGQPEQEYFADGVVEDIITALSRNKALFVIARNSSFAYKGQSPDIREVGRALGVRYVLEGSIRKAGERVRITGQLIDAASGAHSWADRFEGGLDDIFELQDQVSARVVNAIAPVLEQAEIARVLRKPTDSPRPTISACARSPPTTSSPPPATPRRSACSSRRCGSIPASRWPMATPRNATRSAVSGAGRVRRRRSR